MPASAFVFRARTVAALRKAGDSQLVLSGQTVWLSEEAAHLLADYLLLIKLSFQPLKQQAAMHRLHHLIGHYLLQHQPRYSGSLPRAVITDLIARLGCALDWHAHRTGPVVSTE
ncbi:hypothetical protein [Hymenobacter sp. YC55]|uniref:hypothetical protein n=1 Tax=Hymenobacter sp. YC55 TaxID=3034019 RepID=UPI0023F93275|nr:hypothetical protein [Hymenobacter sp. YC55]MDF7814873.1 hypothetical protein [Hymenobacter sp. YC55]